MHQNVALCGNWFKKKRSIQKYGFYGRLIFVLLWYRVKLCCTCIYKVFRLVQGRLLSGKILLNSV